MIEGDIITKQERIDVCSTQADLFSEQEHFDAPAIVAKKAALMERYEKLKVGLSQPTLLWHLLSQPVSLTYIWSKNFSCLSHMQSEIEGAIRRQS